MKLATLVAFGAIAGGSALAQTTPYAPVPPQPGQLTAPDRLPGSILRDDPVDMVDGVPLTTGSLGRNAAGPRDRPGVIAAPTRASPPFVPD